MAGRGWRGQGTLHDVPFGWSVVVVMWEEYLLRIVACLKSILGSEGAVVRWSTTTVRSSLKSNHESWSEQRSADNCGAGTHSQSPTTDAQHVGGEKIHGMWSRLSTVPHPFLCPARNDLVRPYRL